MSHLLSPDPRCILHVSQRTQAIGDYRGIVCGDMSTLAGAAGKVTKADLQASARVLVNRVTGKQDTRPESIIELKSAVRSTPKNVVDAILGTPGSLPTVQKIHLPNEVKRMPKSIRMNLKATQDRKSRLLIFQYYKKRTKSY